MKAKGRWDAGGGGGGGGGRQLAWRELENLPVTRKRGTQLPGPWWTRDIYFLELVFLAVYFCRDFPLNWH